MKRILSTETKNNLAQDIVLNGTPAHFKGSLAQAGWYYFAFLKTLLLAIC
jgi:hypothetical protein